MKPRVAFFEFTSCEGCQLDSLNIEAEILDLLKAVDIVTFREVKSGSSEDYDIAFVEGSITRESEITRLKEIRERAKILVALGACACLGGVNCLKNSLPMEEALKIVYGRDARYYDTIPARPLHDVVRVDHYVRGCPINTDELLKVIKALLLNKRPEIPNYAVCVECKMANNVCVYERGMTCLGPITRAGCGAICITSGRYCVGCRGLVDEANLESQKDILKKYGLTAEQINEKLNIYDSCAGVRK